MSDDRDRDEPPEYTVYRARPALLTGRPRAEDPLAAGPPAPPGGPQRRRWRARLPARLRGAATWKRVLAWLALGAVAWVGLSVVLFLLSAQIEQSKVSGAAERALDHGGFPLTSASTVLVLGSDQRPKSSKEPGAAGLASRSDTIMLLRVGGGKSARLSIPRDTVVDIPGHGRDKINAAYAYGGAALTIATVKRFLGIDVNHLVEVNFANFPRFIDALGGVNVRTGCVRAKVNGGYARGGVTLRLRRGTHHLDGKRALALARVRKNACRPGEDDLARALRQQQILAAIRHRLISPTTFVRLPWVSWEGPRAIRTDMAGPALLGLFGAMATTGDPRTRVLKPSGGIVLPNGGAGLVVSDVEKRVEVRRFLAG